ncbi:general transcription factor IIF subunit 1-like isoform X4 [Crassostrea virginica]
MVAYYCHLHARYINMFTPGTSNSSTQEFIVRVPKDRRKKYKMMKFSTGNDVDFVKMSQTPIRMERENNLKEFKSAYDIDVLPKFGAGSEYGREQKEEARRKKYGIISRKYNPDDQPWILKIGKNKDMKKMKGVREGGITENTSYYIFTQCADGAFEAFPVEEWYTFSPMIKYKYLNSEEAEEEFSRRDKTLNLFSVMVRNRVRNEEDEGNPDEEDKVKAKTKKSKKKEKSEFLITEDEEWANYSDDGNEDEDEGEGADEEEQGIDQTLRDSKSKKKGKNKGKGKRNAKHNSDDEAVEESDEGDFDDREVDYITDSSSDDDMEDREKKDVYEEKGVDEERGLRKLIDSEDEESEEEEDKKSEKAEEEEEDGKAKKEKKKDDGSDSSSSSSSESDSDIEKEENLASVIFMQKGKKEHSSPVPRSATPSSVDGEDKKASKRKLESEDVSSKKSRTESPGASSKTSSAGITEEAIRRYLMRKPMTAKELLKKFKSKKVNMSKEEMTRTLTKYLKKIQPERKTINKNMYFSIKKE